MDAFASPAQLVPGKKYFTHKLGLDFSFEEPGRQKPGIYHGKTKNDRAFDTIVR